jgi:hypothetical protein
MSGYETIQSLAQAAFEAHELPEDFIIEELDGFESQDNGSDIEMSRKIYYRPDEDGDSLTAYFNVRIARETLDIEEAYCIASAGGVLVGEFTDESRRAAYEDAGVPDPRAAHAVSPT